MENAVDALKMAFAIFVFIMALSIVFSLFTQIKDTADSVLYLSDKTNFYEWETGNLTNGRIVGEDTVIATLYNQAQQRSSCKNNIQDWSRIFFKKTRGYRK